MAQIDNTLEEDFRPSAARLVESLRDTGYSKGAAFADIVDNSIAANAKRIHIEFQYLLGEFRVVFIDDGDGMSVDELRNAMRYGSKKRENPKSLGKFGMGLKTASTAFCRRLVVLTHREGERAGKAWDIDHIIKADKWKLETPSSEEYYDDYEALCEFSESSSTMVIWENIDRLINAGSSEKMIEQITALGKEVEDELNAVFYKFLSSGDVEISLKVGDAPIFFLKGWDPLCTNLQTKEGIRSRVLKEKSVSVASNGNTYDFKIRGSIIPSQNELTAAELQTTRYGLDNQGFYIYREGRLIWNDGWPHRIYKKESKISRLRIELHFNHELDDVFSIDFRKSRVIIPIEIREELKRIVAPWRQELLKGQKPNNPQPRKQLHGPANKAISKHDTYTKNSEIDINQGIVSIRNQHQLIPIIIENVRIYADQTIRVHEENSLLGDELWEPSCDERGNTCVSIGQSHPYFQKMYHVCKGNTEAIKAIDMLLWSLANAEYGEFSESNRTTLRGFRQKVSQDLRHLSLELPDPEDEN